MNLSYSEAPERYFTLALLENIEASLKRLVPGKPFYPSLMFVGKAKTLP
jgi:hypothetical protein